jgi:hypothetical protein
VIGNVLYFAATTDDVGTELFSYGLQTQLRSIRQGVPYSGALTGFDADGDPLTYVVSNGPSHGTLTSFNASTGAYTYQSAANYSGYDSITYKVNDGTSDSNLATIDIQINDAPVMDSSSTPALTTIKEDNRTSWGTTVASLTAGITDVFAGAAKGLAITYTSNTSNGTWQYTLDNGTSWIDFPTPSTSMAQLLPADGVNSRIRFLPNQNFNGTVKLGYYAWDQTQGSAGGTFDIHLASSHGGTTAFSTAYRASSLTINPVNDPPAIYGISGTIGYVHDKPAIVLAAAATVSDADSSNFAGGRLTVHIASGGGSSNRISLGAGFSIGPNNTVLQGTTTIGTLKSSGWGTADLVVTFNWSATPTVARDLIRSITFKTVNGAAGLRSINFTLSDGDGGVSVVRTKVVNVM